MSKKQKAPFRSTGGKQPQSDRMIILLADKCLQKYSEWNVICKGNNCRWSAQFNSGRDANNAGWKHHVEAHHSKQLENSHKTECPVTHIFKVARGRGGRASKSGGSAYQIASVDSKGAGK